MLHKPVQKDPRVKDFYRGGNLSSRSYKNICHSLKKKKIKKAKKKATVSLTIANRREKLGFYVSRKILSDWNEVANLLHQSLKNDFTWLDEQ